MIEARVLPVEPALIAFQRVLDGLDGMIRQNEYLKTLSTDAKSEWTECRTNYYGKASAYIANAQVLKQKCTSTAQLLDQIFNYHNQAIARRQSSAVLYLTNKSVDDAATVGVITKITLVFLACTATAVSLPNQCNVVS
jgi:hypothetical protein